jgi:hypothetical protein
MKKAVFSMVLLFSLVSQAEIYFSKGSALPVEAKAKIREEIAARCPDYTKQTWDVWESSTKVVHQFMGDTYTSEMSVYGWDEWFSNPENGGMTVTTTVSPEGVNVVEITGMCR